MEEKVERIYLKYCVAVSPPIKHDIPTNKAFKYFFEKSVSLLKAVEKQYNSGFDCDECFFGQDYDKTCSQPYSVHLLCGEDERSDKKNIIFIEI